MRLPDEQGRLDEWNAVAHQAGQRAVTNWIRLAASMGAGTYEVYEAMDQIGELEWPDLTFALILEMAFKDRYVDSVKNISLAHLGNLGLEDRGCQHDANVRVSLSEKVDSAPRCCRRSTRSDPSAN